MSGLIAMTQGLWLAACRNQGMSYVGETLPHPPVFFRRSTSLCCRAYTRLLDRHPLRVGGES